MVGSRSPESHFSIGTQRAVSVLTTAIALCRFLAFGHWRSAVASEVQVVLNVKSGCSAQLPGTRLLNSRKEAAAVADHLLRVTLMLLQASQLHPGKSPVAPAAS